MPYLDDRVCMSMFCAHVWIQCMVVLFMSSDKPTLLVEASQKNNC
jgi:hypothetical protein